MGKQRESRLAGKREEGTDGKAGKAGKARKADWWESGKSRLTGKRGKLGKREKQTDGKAGKAGKA
ncbi:MAG: hypothetical protein FWH55_08860, partial [Oscillospiraceae bacterium]|nr:hypothetical protein [Oscillospiraceae bacterium]